MPSKPSTGSATSKFGPKSPPKTRRSTRKRALSSTDIAEPPAKKIATGDGEEAKESEEKGVKRGKGTRYVKYPIYYLHHTDLIIFIGKLHLGKR
jgi:hypothetical protein